MKAGLGLQLILGIFIEYFNNSHLFPVGAHPELSACESTVSGWAPDGHGAQYRQA
jgi:hypothetical protein